MKFITIVDIPNDCIRSLNWNVQVEVQTGILIHSYETRLKPLPQKKELEESGNSLIDDCKEYYTDGWNDCVDEILGEEVNGEAHLCEAELVDKTKPLNPILEGDGYADGDMVYDMASCPSCGNQLTEDEYDFMWKKPYCPYCGQALDWNFPEEEEE